MESKDAYKEKIDEQLKEWSIKLADLKTKAEFAEANVKVEYLKQLELLSARKEKAQAKLEELKIAGDEAWESLTTGVEKAVSELKDAINSAIAKFK